MLMIHQFYYERRIRILCKSCRACDILGISRTISSVYKDPSSFEVHDTEQDPTPPCSCFSVSWVVDGIGKAMAFALAKKGLNVLLISRTESKLVDAETELKKACPKIVVEHLAIDYSNFDDVAQVSVSLVPASTGVPPNLQALIHFFPR